jgi:hypothetical protein
MTPPSSPSPSSPSPRAAIRDQAALDKAAALVLETLDRISRAGRISKNPEVEALADLAVRTGMEAMNTLMGKLGAASPLRARQQPVSESEPDKFALSSLVALDTPASRRLLALLMETLEAAEQVDWERGRALDESVPLLPGESRGTDLAESISEIALRVRTEVHGPQGRE